LSDVRKPGAWSGGLSDAQGPTIVGAADLDRSAYMKPTARTIMPVAAMGPPVQAPHKLPMT